MEAITIEQMYDDFVKKTMGFRGEEYLHPEQKEQLKQAFYAGIGSYTLLIKQTLLELDNDQQEVLMLAIDEELKEFWKKYTT